VKILLADDEPIARTMLEHWLSGWGYAVTPVRDGQAALDALRADCDLRLAIIDWVMPRRDGLEVCREIRKGPQEPYVYVVLLTAKDDKSDIIAGLDAGADDYLVKPCNPLELKVRLRAGRRVLELQEQLVHAREALRFQAMNDPLTGLLTRGALMELLEKELLRSARSSAPVSAIMADLDHFNAVNVAHGRGTGDAVLREAARRLKGGVRAYDSIARADGEQFVAVLPDCDANEGMLVAERVRQALSEKPFCTDAGALALTVSVGIASTDQFGAASAEALIRAADSALRSAKQAGRAHCVLASAADFQGERAEPALRRVRLTPV
jgi:two-component system cell cycle response regulator